jgi:hypothetical protein
MTISCLCQQMRPFSAAPQLQPCITLMRWTTPGRVWLSGSQPPMVGTGAVPSISWGIALSVARIVGSYAAVRASSAISAAAAPRLSIGGRLIAVDIGFTPCVCYRRLSALTRRALALMSCII